MICHPCKYQLEKSYQFKKKCEAADTKLRKHVKQINQLTQDENDEESESQDSQNEVKETQSTGNSKKVKQLLADLVTTKGDQAGQDISAIEVTEEELVGGYILGMNAENVEVDESYVEAPENITLIPAEGRTAKARCTIKGARIKQEHESDEDGQEMQQVLVNSDHQNMYVMEVVNTGSQNSTLNMQAIKQSISHSVQNFAANQKTLQQQALGKKLDQTILCRCHFIIVKYSFMMKKTWKN